MQEDSKLLFSLGLAGIVIGVAKLLASDAPIKIRQAIGRCILHGGLGIGAASVVAFIPTLTFATQVGMACVFASLGASALEKMFANWSGGGSQ